MRSRVVCQNIFYLDLLVSFDKNSTLRLLLSSISLFNFIMERPVYRFGQKPPPENGLMDPPSMSTVARPKRSESLVSQGLDLGAAKQDQGAPKRSTGLGPMNISAREQLLIENARTSGVGYNASTSLAPELIPEGAVHAYYPGLRAHDSGKARNAVSPSGSHPGNGPGGQTHESTDTGRGMHTNRKFSRPSFFPTPI